MSPFESMVVGACAVVGGRMGWHVIQRNTQRERHTHTHTHTHPHTQMRDAKAVAPVLKSCFLLHEVCNNATQLHYGKSVVLKRANLGRARELACACVQIGECVRMGK